MSSIIKKVKRAYEKEVIITLHAKEEARRDGMKFREVREVLQSPILVEDYPDDPRGHSCLLLGFTRAGKPLHIVCSPKPYGLVIVTVYEPSLYEWQPDYKKRKRR